MTPQVDYLEVRATALSRDAIRLGLQRLKHRRLPIDWFEREGCWRSLFVVWGHPVLIARLEQMLGHLAMRPPPLSGRNLDIVA